MSVDENGFKRALSQFASGVTIVTTRDGRGNPIGLTVSAFCSVSLEPPLVLVCIDERSSAVAAIGEGGRFGVSLLAEHQQDISNRFARLGDDKFVGLELIRRPTGTTLIPEALAQLDCRLVTPHVAGDHTLFVGEVEYVEVNPGRPLLYHAAAYRRLGPSPEGADSKSAGSPWPAGRDRV